MLCTHGGTQFPEFSTSINYNLLNDSHTVLKELLLTTLLFYYLMIINLKAPGDMQV